MCINACDDWVLGDNLPEPFRGDRRVTEGVDLRTHDVQQAGKVDPGIMWMDVAGVLLGVFNMNRALGPNGGRGTSSEFITATNQTAMSKRKLHHVKSKHRILY